MKDPLLDNFISDSFEFNNEPGQHSSLAAALRDARTIANRDVVTGKVTLENEEPHYPNSWASALLYFIVLDQIGTCFVNRAKKFNNYQGFEIYKALKHFSDLSDKEAYALESLRHAFSHNYGLCNVKHSKTGGIVNSHTHIFILTAEPIGNLITLPALGKEWSGNYSTKLDGSYTYVNLWLLGDFVENVFKTLRSVYDNDEVELILNGGLHELKARFSFYSK